MQRKRLRDEVLDALARCEFVLRRIGEGDNRAMENATTVAVDVRRTLRRAGRAPEA